MHVHRTVMATAILLILEGACAHAGKPGPARGSRDLLTATEVAEHPTLQTATAYDAVSHLRPEYLATTTTRADGLDRASVTVFVDGVPRGGLDILRTIPTTLITEIRFVRPPESALRYGQAHRWGAILVTTRKK